MCSWNFLVRGTAAGDAIVTFNFLSEQGTIALGGMTFQVVKHGWLSGHWSLESGAGPYAQAVKPNALYRSFNIDAGGKEFQVAAASAFGRTFSIAADGQTLGTIRPAHPFTRRAFVECEAAVPELVQLFAFWLTALTWKRAANNNS